MSILRYAALAAALTVAPPLAAQTCGPVVATQIGDRLYAADVDALELEVLMPEVFADRREGAVLYLVEGSPPVWSDIGLDEATVLSGAAELVYQGRPECDPRGPREDLVFDEDEGTVVEPADDLVFTSEQGTIVDPAAVAGWVQPRDGLWRAEVGPSEIDGCPPMMRSAFPTAAPLPGFSQEPRRLAFSRPFDPNALELSRTARVTWRRDAATQSFVAEMAPEVFAQIPQGEGGGSRLAWRLRVESPGAIVFARRMEIVLPDVAAAVVGMAGPCAVTGTDRWIRIGD